jgi:hypothetical protein
VSLERGEQHRELRIDRGGSALEERHTGLLVRDAQRDALGGDEDPDPTARVVLLQEARDRIADVLRIAGAVDLLVRVRLQCGVVVERHVEVDDVARVNAAQAPIGLADRERHRTRVVHDHEHLGVSGRGVHRRRREPNDEEPDRIRAPRGALPADMEPLCRTSSSTRCRTSARWSASTA